MRWLRVLCRGKVQSALQRATRTANGGNKKWKREGSSSSFLFFLDSELEANLAT
jgi:hypothetical protein